MSNDLRDAVWQNGPTDPTQRFVLLSLADRADDNGYCWPSFADIAKRTGYTKRTVINAMSKLETDGWITSEVRYKHGKARTSNGTHLNAKRLLGSESVSLDSELNSLPNEQKPPLVVNDVHWGSEFNSPESYIESIKEIETPRPPLQILRDHFSQRTTIQPNEQTGMYERNWEKPLAAILEKARGDPLAAVALIDAALDVAWGKNDSGKTYPVASPKSIATIAANLAVSSKATATAADDETIWQRALQAITRKEYSDERLKAAIRAVGFDRIARANGHDADQLRKQLGNEYRSNIRNTAPA